MRKAINVSGIVTSFILLTYAVSPLFSDSPYDDGLGFQSTDTTYAMNCRLYATQCRTDQLNTCLTLNSGDGICSGCTEFTPVAYIISNIRQLGFCSTPQPGEATLGCAVQNPVECARYTCFSGILNGTCIGSMKSGFIYWSSGSPTDFCLFAN